MKDNYLWDRSGEPDPELQKLEDILGSLRYQPQPLEIPTDIRVGHRRSFFPPLAMAAAIGLFAVILGLWFYFSRTASTPTNLEARPASQPKQNAIESQSTVASDNGSSQTAPVKSPGNNQKPDRTSGRDLVATHRKRPIRKEESQPVLTPQELAEKEQVLIALRLASFKLNLAQRRTQGTSPLNTIRNQHKIG
jgi:hypothetical protein